MLPPADQATEPTDDETPSEPEDQPESGGYLLALKVRPDGSLAVCKKPLEAEQAPPVEGAAPPDEGTYDEIEVDNIEQALKAILKLYKDNPIEAGEEAHLQAGYHAESAPSAPMALKGY